MNTFRKLLSGFLAISMLAACSDDISDKKGNGGSEAENDPEGSYLSLDILMPNGRNPYSRSETLDDGSSSGDTEIGTAEENYVGSALIVLARRSNYGFIAAGEVKSSNLTSLNSVKGDEYRALTRIYKSNLAAYYDDREDLTTNPQVYVFVFCNPNKDLVDLFRYGETADYNNTLWYNAAARVTEGEEDKSDYNMGIWAPNSFLMNNAELAIRELPKNITEWEAYSTSDNPFHLSDENPPTEFSTSLPNNSADAGRGEIRVERSVARFDFKDGSKLGNARYHVLYHAHNGIAQDGSEEGMKEEPLVDVQLYTMCLVNMSNSFYYVPRVSNNGRNTTTNTSGVDNGWTLCGKEKPFERNDADGTFSGGNYAVGPYSGKYVEDIQTNFSTYFNYAFFEDGGEFNVESPAADRWAVYNVKDVATGPVGDNYVNGENGVHSAGTYRVWRYVTENVIPGGPDNQVNGISTGIVFKARLLGGSYAYNTTLNDESAEFWEKNTFEEIAKVLNGEEYTLSDGSIGKITGDTYTDPILYYTDGKLYMNWRHVRQGAIQAAVTPVFDGGDIKSIEINRSNSLYRAVFGNGGIPDGMVYCYIDDKGNEKVYQIKGDDRAWSQTSADYLWTVWDAAGRKNDEKLTAFRKAVTDNDITIYQSSKHVDPSTGEVIPGYYCYYYYWNRHNDNNLAGIMGPMEFAVVRNNVYKLSVDKISRLGHPRIPDNDPEDPKPGTPDEVAEVYIDINIQVMPWAVRLNSITF